MLEAPNVTSFAINPEGLPNITVEGCSRFIREDEFEDYRDWVAAALAEARAEGRRQGLEEAAKAIEARYDGPDVDHEGPYYYGGLSEALSIVQELIGAQVETQTEEIKP